MVFTIAFPFGCACRSLRAQPVLGKNIREVILVFGMAATTAAAAATARAANTLFSTFLGLDHITSRKAEDGHKHNN